jgi:hypothetical protein
LRRILPFVSILAFASPALAQAVDAQGAAQLQESLSRYVGKTAFEKGVLKVAADGDAYKIDLDMKALLALLPAEAKVKAEFTPYALRVKPRADGDWDVSGDMMPNGSVDFAGPEGQQKMEWTIADGKFSGVYDPDLATFSTATGSYGSMKMTSTDALTKTDASTGAGNFSMTAGSAAAGQGIDFTSAQTMADFMETIDFTTPDAQLPFPIVLRSPKYAIDAKGAGFRSKPILDLVAFFVANAEEAKIKANQGELKTLLLAALPLWDNLAGGGGFTDLAVPTPMGEFGASLLGLNFDFDGISQSGELTYGFKLAGLKVPAEAAQLAPAWAVSLLPTDLEINLGGANLNLDGPARKAIEAMDLTKEPPLPDAVSSQIEADFKANPPKFIIGRSFIKNADTEISTTGEVTFPEANPEKPDVNMTIEATGYDKMVEVIQNASATDTDAQQAFPVLLAVKGFGKTLPDGKIQWVVNAKPDGSVIVNGGMVKGPDAPEPAPEPVDPNAPPGTLTNPNP